MVHIKRTIDRFIRRGLSFLPHKMAHSCLFYITHKYFMDWDNPQTYDEKLTWALANLIGEREAVFADKYLVREYVKSNGFEAFLPKIYGIWDDADSIDFDVLPQRFVLKANHAAGEKFYYICKDKTKINKKEVRDKFRLALHSSIWRNQCEYHYKYIKPVVYAEEFLDDGRGNRMTDYKVHCFMGKPECILVCTNRDKDLHLDYYDKDWNYIDVVPEKYKSNRMEEAPKGLPIMLEIAEKLSAPFPTARIDFYDINGRVYFGEITLTPAGGNLRYINSKWQRILGEKIDYSGCSKGFTIY